MSINNIHKIIFSFKPLKPLMTECITKTMKKHLTPIVLAALLLSGCVGPVARAPQGNAFEIAQEVSKQKALAYERIVNEQSRLYGVSFPIFAANAPACGNHVRPGYGLSVWNAYTPPREYRDAAAGMYRLNDALMVQTIAPHSPAVRAGLSPGDTLISINGQELRGAMAVKNMQQIMRSAGLRPSEIVFEHKGRVSSGVIDPVSICDYPVGIDPTPVINAQTDGKIIIVTHGIMRFVESDDELALVVAHELGHNTMGHINKKMQNGLAGSLGGLAVDAVLAAAGVAQGNQFSQLGSQLGAAAYSVQFEQEADYIGMYFMARAGFDTSGVADFWRRMAAEGQSSIDHNTSHPSSPARFLAIEQTHAEIAAKQRSGRPLNPNLR